MVVRFSQKAKLAGAGILSAAALLCAGASLAQSAPAPAAGGVDMVHAKETVETVCKNCHDLSVVTDARYDRSGWQNVIIRMQAQGLSISNEQRKEILEYLTTNYAAS